MNNILKLSFFWTGILLYSCHQNVATTSGNSADTIDSLDVSGVRTDSLYWANDTLQLYKIDSASFFEAKLKAGRVSDTVPYVADFETAKKMLKGRITFGGHSDTRVGVDSTIDGQAIAMLRFDNGEVIDPKEQPFFWDYWFVGYFPSEDIVLFEGGHSSDFSIDLRQGLVEVEKVGNPKYAVFSPSNKYRLTGWFPGQECSSYFIQKQGESGYNYYAEVPIHVGAHDFLLCHMVNSFWANDSTLYFHNTFYDNRIPTYFKLVIR